MSWNLSTQGAFTPGNGDDSAPQPNKCSNIPSLHCTMDSVDLQNRDQITNDRRIDNCLGHLNRKWAVAHSSYHHLYSPSATPPHDMTNQTSDIGIISKQFVILFISRLIYIYHYSLALASSSSSPHLFEVPNTTRSLCWSSQSQRSHIRMPSS